MNAKWWIVFEWNFSHECHQHEVFSNHIFSFPFLFLVSFFYIFVVSGAVVLFLISIPTIFTINSNGKLFIEPYLNGACRQCVFWCIYVYSILYHRYYSRAFSIVATKYFFRFLLVFCFRFYLSSFLFFQRHFHKHVPQ